MPNATHLSYHDLGLSPVALNLGFLELRWYSLAYLAGLLLAFVYARKLARQPGSPMSVDHVEDLLFFGSLGVILGGRLGYVLFYNLQHYLSDPIGILRLWDGGMSFHGGVLGVTAGILWVARKHGLNWLRVHDWVAVTVPFGLLFGRLANFVNGELWGAPSQLPWAIRFPEVINGVQTLGPPRHPSQLYEALLEGLVLAAILSLMFWKSRARYQPGMLVGAFLFFYGLFRFAVEFVRQPDSHLVDFARATGLHMGQWLCVPMILGGLYLMLTAARRRQRIEPMAGGTSVA